MRLTVAWEEGKEKSGRPQPLFTFRSSLRNSFIRAGSEIEPCDRMLSWETALLSGKDGMSEAPKQLREMLMTKNTAKKGQYGLMMR